MTLNRIGFARLWSPDTQADKLPTQCNWELSQKTIMTAMKYTIQSNAITLNKYAAQEILYLPNTKPMWPILSQIANTIGVKILLDSWS